MEQTLDNQPEWEWYQIPVPLSDIALVGPFDFVELNTNRGRLSHRIAADQWKALEAAAEQRSVSTGYLHQRPWPWGKSKAHALVARPGQLPLPANGIPRPRIPLPPPPRGDNCRVEEEPEPPPPAKRAEGLWESSSKSSMVGALKKTAA